MRGLTLLPFAFTATTNSQTIQTMSGPCMPRQPIFGCTVNLDPSAMAQEKEPRPNDKGL
jgi:hypothetical protein